MKTYIGKLIATSIIFLWSIAVFAQNKSAITGTVVDTKGEPIPYASAVLYDGDKILTGSVTDEKGRFSLAVDSSSKKLELSVEFIGYVKKPQWIFLHSSM